MRINAIALCAILSLGLAGCDKKADGDNPEPAEEVATKKPAAKPAANAEIPCDPSKDIDKHESGKLARCYPKTDHEIDGVTCRGGGYYIDLYESGKLKECTIAEGQTVKTNAGACKGDFERYESGAVKECTFTGETREIGGVTCHWRADHHEDGSLRRCQVAAKSAVGGVDIPPKSWVTLAGGKVSRLELSSANAYYPWKGYHCTEVYFHPNGSPSICATAEKMAIKGETTPLNTHLCFDADGSKAKEPPNALCVDWDKVVKVAEKAEELAATE